ncbi:hypothetical protein V6B16_05315 [Salinimicrobium catena]|uniref:hypothetical protein n=1 Tax=Salinimicrobium catena TaxID=390640 RepID=UPI002FE4D01E
MRKLFFTILVVSLFFTACKTPISGYYSYDTECMGKNYDGSQIVKTWGTGEDVKSAKIRAYQEALHDVLFEGIRNGNSDCNMRPLITEVNALEKYDAYFNHFFSEKGNYREFIKQTRNNKKLVRNNRSNMKEAYGYIVEIDIPALKQQLRTDDIIP